MARLLGSLLVLVAVAGPPGECPDPVSARPSRQCTSAVAFCLGFKGNTAYGRLWEARQIWGGIVNSSRAWAVFVRDYVTTHFVQSPAEDVAVETIHHELIHRHIAWLHALRTTLRRRKPWETQTKAAREFRLAYETDDMSNAVLRARLAPHLDSTRMSCVE